jgi:hypothetical protein
MTETETRRYKARQTLYRRAALDSLEYDSIGGQLEAISEECDDITYYYSYEDTLLDALDGDSDEAYEFRMMFTDLSVNCERLNEALQYVNAREYFNDVCVGLVGSKWRTVGYDGYEEDWRALTQFEAELAQTEKGGFYYES